MISLFSSIKEFLPDSREYPFKGGLVKKKKSVIIDPYTCLPDSNKIIIKGIGIRWPTHAGAMAKRSGL